jgi:hypothetical protein
VKATSLENGGQCPQASEGQVLSSGDVVDGVIEEAVVQGCAVDKASKDMIEECRVTNRLVDTSKLYICTLLDPRFKKFNFWSTHKYVNNPQ